MQHGPGCNVTALTYIAGLICNTLIFINRKHSGIFHSFVRFKNRFLKKEINMHDFRYPSMMSKLLLCYLKKE